MLVVLVTIAMDSAMPALTLDAVGLMKEDAYRLDYHLLMKYFRCTDCQSSIKFLECPVTPHRCNQG
jgi:hypothetical protein